MNRKLLVIYDKEELYVQSLVAYLQQKKDFPYCIQGFTKEEELIKAAASKEISILLVSETAYSDTVKNLSIKKVFILNETGAIEEPSLQNLDKYQAGEHFVKEILNYYVEQEEISIHNFKVKTNTRLIGFFSPVKRCLQTSMGLTLGHLLAEKHKTLYLNFECFSGFSTLGFSDAKQDMSDLLYYRESAPEKFIYRFKTMVSKVGELYLVPPMISMHSQLLVRQEEWLALLGQIMEEGDFEFIILDLSESIQGLLEILRMCNKIYTIVKEDRFARAKIEQYEQLLQLYEYEDILGKTEKRELPYIKELPSSIEYYHTGELSLFVNRLLEEDSLYA